MGKDRNLDLELNVLTRSDLIDGRGVKMISIKEDGTTVSTEYYPGKNSSSETIVLQMKSSHSGQLKFRTASSEGPEVSSKWSGLYDVLSQVSGGKIRGDDMQASIHNEMRENWKEYLPQIQQQTWRDSGKFYTIPGYKEEEKKNKQSDIKAEL